MHEFNPVSVRIPDPELNRAVTAPVNVRLRNNAVMPDGRIRLMDDAPVKRYNLLIGYQ